MDEETRRHLRAKIALWRIGQAVAAMEPDELEEARNILFEIQLGAVATAALGMELALVWAGREWYNANILKERRK